MDFFHPERLTYSAGARYPSGKGEVCKTFMRRFDSDPRLQSSLSYSQHSTTFAAVTCPRVSVPICDLLRGSQERFCIRLNRLWRTPSTTAAFSSSLLVRVPAWLCIQTVGH